MGTSHSKRMARRQQAKPFTVIKSYDLWKSVGLTVYNKTKNK